LHLEDASAAVSALVGEFSLIGHSKSPTDWPGMGFTNLEDYAVFSYLPPPEDELTA